MLFDRIKVRYGTIGIKHHKCARKHSNAPAQPALCLLHLDSSSIKRDRSQLLAYGPGIRDRITTVATKSALR